MFYTRAGAEIGVASTKAFTTQLAALFILTLTLAKLRGRLAPEDEHRHVEALRHLPGGVQHALNLEPQIQGWAERFAGKQHALFLGRGLHYPIALEGALKLKEISYIHAEAYPAGELKHGPLALVDRDMPVVVIAPNDALLEKVKSNMQEVRAAAASCTCSPTPTAASPTPRACMSSAPRATWACCRRSCTRSRCSCWPTTPRLKGHGRGQAPQSGEIGDGGIERVSAPVSLSADN